MHVKRKCVNNSFYNPIGSYEFELALKFLKIVSFIMLEFLTTFLKVSEPRPLQASCLLPVPIACTMVNISKQTIMKPFQYLDVK